MKQTMLVLVTAAVTAAGAWSWMPPVAAHHSEAPFYDLDRTVEVRGSVTKWEFKNPHPFLYVEVEEGGAKVEYVVELIGAVRLAKIGWTAKTFVPGEVVTVAGHPSRAPGTHGISSARVMRADGSLIAGSGRGGGA